MSHYAKVKDGIVVQVIVAEADFFNHFKDTSPGSWIQTSYNTRANIHYGPDGKPDEGVALRGNYAGVGFSYDAANDVFYAPQPFPSWEIDKNTWTWQPPIPYPTDGGYYIWNEPRQSWVKTNTQGQL